MGFGNATETLPAAPSPPPASVVSVVDGRATPPPPGTNSSVENTGAAVPNIVPPLSAADVQPVALTRERKEVVVKQLVDAYATWEINSLFTIFGSDESTAKFMAEEVVPKLSYTPSKDHPLTEENFEDHCGKSTFKHMDKYLKRQYAQVQNLVENDSVADTVAKIDSIVEKTKEEERAAIIEMFSEARQALNHIQTDDLESIKEAVKKRVPSAIESSFQSHGLFVSYYRGMMPEMEKLLLPHKLSGILTSADSNLVRSGSEVRYHGKWYTVTNIQLNDGLGEIEVSGENQNKKVITIFRSSNDQSRAVKVDGRALTHPNLPILP
ncbi:hypothetical protein HOH87_02290 [bacterium]|jgi:hypothetical protein|nr:hypothetical protein [bacterium]